MTTYSWFPVGQRLEVAFEATQERRVNAVGAVFTHGPQAGRFEYETYVSLPKSRSKKPRLTPEEVASKHEVALPEVGSIDGPRLLSFIWRIAGRPSGAPANWQRVIALWIVLDNYSVHKCSVINEALAELAAAGIHLFYLPAYSPELSDIEPVWNDLKHHGMPFRSYETAGSLKRAVDTALASKAAKLQRAYSETAS